MLTSFIGSSKIINECDITNQPNQRDRKYADDIANIDYEFNHNGTT